MSKALLKVADRQLLTSAALLCALTDAAVVCGHAGDYTEGVPGVGIVNALEIVRAFPTDDDLRNFRDWVNLPDTEALALAQGKGKQPGELTGNLCSKRALTSSAKLEPISRCGICSALQSLSVRSMPLVWHHTPAACIA